MSKVVQHDIKIIKQDMEIKASDGETLKLISRNHSMIQTICFRKSEKEKQG